MAIATREKSMPKRLPDGMEWLQASLPIDLKKRLRIEAALNDCSMTELLIKILDEQLPKHKQGEG
jgi:hypothetical protein